jgi:probable rRNA maturation factor
MRNRVCQVRVTNLNRPVGLDVKFVDRLACRMLKALGKERTSEIDIVFMDDAAIRQLNRRYKKEDSATDVLSFGIDGREFLRRRVLGEIFVSLETAARNARLFGVTFEEEAVRCVVHGMLHLFGYDDATKAGRAAMWRAQERIMGDLWRREDLSKVLTRR